MREHWQRVEELYHSALALSGTQRAAFLHEACAGDDVLYRDVESLLAHSSAASGFLDAPAIEVAANLVDDHGSLIGRQLGVYRVPGLPQILPGTRLGPYQIETLLGAGGMGCVFRARDTRLGRPVAIKVCLEAFSARFEREARSIAALNHPHVCTLYDIGPNYLVMELVEGETLASVLAKGARSVDDALSDGTQIADALAAAHARGIVHRDLKPGNVMITPAGVKVLDFGLAKRTTPAAADDDAETMAPTAFDARTEVGQMMGTVAYMSPEQAEGKPVDARSDVFALGVVLYEMLCGKRPFGGETTLAALASTLQSVPDAPRSLRKEIPAGAERIVLRCLEKKPEARYDSARELHRDLVALRAAKTTGARGMRAALIAVGLTVAVGAGVWGVRSYVAASRVAWVEREAVPEITRLINENRRLAALTLFRQAESYAPASPALFTLAEGVVTTRVTFRTTPAGARIYIADYMDATADAVAPGQLLGATPFDAEIPRWGYYRVRAAQEGFAPVEQTYFPAASPLLELTLHAEREAPPGMVWVPAGAATAPAPAADLPGYWMDTYEVSNRAFKTFADAGGYSTERVLETRVHEGRARDPVADSHGGISRRHQTDGSCRLATGNLPGRRRRPARWRAELVRGGGIRRVHGQESADGVRMVCRGRCCRRRLRYSPVEQLRRPGTCPHGNLSGNGPLRKLRHGRQPEGMGREPPRRPALRARRLLERAGIRVQPLRCQTAPFARAHGWIPPGPARHSSA